MGSRLNLGVSRCGCCCGCGCMIPQRSCISIRTALIIFGCLKIMLAIILVPIVNEPIYIVLRDYDLDFFLYHKRYAATFCVLLALLIADIAFHSMLVLGAFQRKVNLLVIYYKYVMLLMLLALLLCLTHLLSDMLGFNHIYFLFPNATYAYWFTFLVIQSIVMMLIEYEIKIINNATVRRATNESIFKIEISGGTEKVVPMEHKEAIGSKHVDIGSKYEDTGCKKEDTGFKNEDTTCKNEDTGCKKEDTACKNDDTECKNEDTGCKNENTGCKNEDTECKNEDTGYKNEDTGCKNEDTGCTNEDTGCKTKTFIQLATKRYYPTKIFEVGLGKS